MTEIIDMATAKEKADAAAKEAADKEESKAPAVDLEALMAKMNEMEAEIKQANERAAAAEAKAAEAVLSPSAIPLSGPGRVGLTDRPGGVGAEVFVPPTPEHCKPGTHKLPSGNTITNAPPKHKPN